MLVFEGLIYVLFGGCLWHASRQGRFQVLELVWAGLYGFLLEWITIKQLQAYQYGTFMIMIDGAPLAIALGWGVVIYTSMLFSNRIQLPEAARPIVDGLLALNIDLALDAVAIRIGMWSWTGVRLDQQWFGVPWANFWAWFIVVWSFSGCIRALRPWRRLRIRRWLYPPAAIFLSLLVLIVTSEVFRLTADNLGAGGLAPFVLVLGSLGIIVDLRPTVTERHLPEPLIILVPLTMHVFALTAGFAYGVFGRQPVLAVVGVVMLVVGLFVHLLPWWVGRSKSRRAARIHLV